MRERAPVLLIPGLACNRLVWERQIADLKDTADVWVAPLQPCEELGRIADIILEQAPSTFSLIGHSMGGYIAFEILRRAPERVNRLALLSTTARPEARSTTVRRVAMLNMMDEQGIVELADAFFARFVAPCHQRSREMRDYLRKSVFETGTSAFALHSLAMMRRPDYRDGLAGLPHQTVVIAGEDDVVTPVEDHQEIVDLMPNARLEVIPKCGHMGMIEQPALLSGVLSSWLGAEQGVEEEERDRKTTAAA